MSEFLESRPPRRVRGLRVDVGGVVRRVRLHSLVTGPRSQSDLNSLGDFG